MEASAVIGANFGDEGKGHLVDYLSDEFTLVVRFNGGAQAGHTVVTPEGKRHIFHHYGAGSLRGAGTYLSQFFVVNPLIWLGEKFDMDDEGVAVPAHRLYVHYDAPLSTPYDMLINQFQEVARGAGRHGSCGAGIHETMNRNRYPGLATVASDMFDLNGLKRKLLLIRGHTSSRFTAIQEAADSKSFAFYFERVFDDRLVEKYLEAVERFLDEAQFRSRMPSYHRVVFEGAQGLLLDEDHRYFPYVTHSKTGVANILKIAEENDVKDLDVYFVTRTYLTRHGPGPFETEDPGLRYYDNTNDDNQWQGKLRFGRFDKLLFRDSVERELEQLVHSHLNSVTPRAVVNCADQAMLEAEVIIDDIQDLTDLRVSLVGHGPTRKDYHRRT